MIAIGTLVLAVLFSLASPGIAGELCLLGSAVNVSAACNALHVYPNTWIGYRSGGGEPCQDDEWPLGCASNFFGWAISRSAVDPHHNTDPFPLGTGQLYLWYYCTSHPWGLAAAEFDVGGSIAVHSFTPMNGFTNAGDATHLLLAVGGCPGGPLLAGTFQVHDPIAVDATTWGRIKSTYR